MLIARVVISPRSTVPSLKEKSFAVVPRSVDNGGMIEIHIKYHRLYSGEFVKPRPITKARQMCIQTKSRFVLLHKIRMRSPIVERKEENRMA